MKVFEQKKGGYLLSTDPALLDLDYIYQFLTKAYWCKGRSKARVARSLSGSLCFGIYGPEGQVGLARVISDYATFAYMSDVFIDPQVRGKGLGKWLVQSMLDHPALQDTGGWMLQTLDAQGLYSAFGFYPKDTPYEIMLKKVVSSPES
ncbi:MAG: GNAT family N-acetyltransferase [Bacteroidota bacterium]